MSSESTRDAGHRGDGSSSPEHADLHARLVTALGHANPIPALLLSAMIDDPAGVSQLTVTDLAQRAGTSQASVVRTARSLGFAGYPQLRLALAASAAQRSAQQPTASFAGPIADSDDIDVVVGTMAALETEALDATARTVDRSALSQAADALAGARIVDCYGIGASGLVALDLEQKLSRVGLVSRARTTDDDALTSAALLGASDVAVVVSHSGQTPAMVAATRTARRAHACVVAVTTDPGSAMASSAEHVLVAAGRETPFRAGAMASRTSCLLLVDCLYVAVVQRLGDPARAALARTYGVLSETGGTHRA